MYLKPSKLWGHTNNSKGPKLSLKEYFFSANKFTVQNQRTVVLFQLIYILGDIHYFEKRQIVNKLKNKEQCFIVHRKYLHTSEGNEEVQSPINEGKSSA